LKYFLAPLFLNLGTRWRWTANFTPPLLAPPPPPGSNRGTHLIEGCVGLSASLDVLEKGNISCPYRDSNVGLSTRSLVTIPTELIRGYVKSGDISVEMNELYVYPWRCLVGICISVTMSCWHMYIRDDVSLAYVHPWRCLVGIYISVTMSRLILLTRRDFHNRHYSS
jgi:hypothetical protein